MDDLDKRKVVGFNVGTSLIRTMMPDDKAAYRAAVAATTGRLVAFDPRTGKVAWAVDYPAAWNGGTMTTAGNLVFQGTSTGRFRAYAADTGKQLLDLDMQSGIVSAPSTRSEEHTSELQSLMRISYAVFCLKKKKQK